MKPKIYYLSRYVRTQEYGGPEEGGWYYDWFDYLDTVKVKINPKYWTPTKQYKKLVETVEQTCIENGKYRYEGGIVSFYEKTPRTHQTR